MQPNKVGRYRVVAALGQGAMGVVYQARDDQMGRDVAVKMMMATLESDSHARARFFREAQLTSRLLHRNIVTIFDLGEEDGHPYIVMEFLRGATLARAHKDGLLADIESKLDVMIQTCDGLSRAHAEGIVHRDIKPSNLFLLPDGSLKILDFGVARLADSAMTKSGQVVGTPDFMSPEQARGEDVDVRSDVFSAAAVFYYLITGRRPFEAPDVPAVLLRVVNDDPPPIPGVDAPSHLARIVLRALRKNPDYRYQTAAEMSADLSKVKRHIEAETRQLGIGVCEQYSRLRKVAGGAEALHAQLKRTASASLTEGLAQIAREFPFVVAPLTDSGRMLIPMRRALLIRAGEEIDRAHAAVLATLERLAIESAQK